MPLVTFGIDKIEILLCNPPVHSTIYTTTFNTIPTRNSTSPNYRSKHTCTLLYTLTD